MPEAPAGKRLSSQEELFRNEKRNSSLFGLDKTRSQFPRQDSSLINASAGRRKSMISHEYTEKTPIVRPNNQDVLQVMNDQQFADQLDQNIVNIMAIAAPNHTLTVDQIGEPRDSSTRKNEGTASRQTIKHGLEIIT